MTEETVVRKRLYESEVARLEKLFINELREFYRKNIEEIERLGDNHTRYLTELYITMFGDDEQ